jgi:HEAT repeat protein
MGWLKVTLDLIKAKKEAADASLERSKAESELYVDLMRVRDPSLKDEDIDKRRLVRFLVDVPCFSPIKEIPLAFKGLNDGAWEIRWTAIHTLVRLGAELHRQQTSGWKADVTVETVLDRVGRCLNDPDQRVRAEAAEALKRLERYLESNGASH